MQGGEGGADASGEAGMAVDMAGIFSVGIMINGEFYFTIYF